MINVGLSEVLRFGIMMVLTTISGIFLLINSKLRFTLSELLSFGSVAGMALTCIGIGLTHVFGWASMGWTPHILVIGLGVRTLVVNKWRLDRHTIRLRLLTLQVASILGLLSAVVRYLPQLNIGENGGWNLDTDIQFLLSIGTESIKRIPEVFPSAATSPIAYTWLFSGTNGRWADWTGANIFETMLVFWPITFAVLLPIVLFFTAWITTKNAVVAVVSPIAYVFLSGQTTAPGLRWMVEQPIFMGSPHRDFSTLFLLVLVSVIAKIDDQSQRSRKNFAFVAVVFLLSFGGAGSKGSVAILLLSAFLIVLVFAVLRRRILWDLATISVLALIGIFIAQVSIVSGISGSNSHPVVRLVPSFFSYTTGYGTTEPQLAGILFVTSSIVWTAVVLIGINTVSSSILQTPIKLFLSSLQCVSLVGSMFLSVSGESQMYLIQSMRPIGTIFVVFAVVQALEQQRLKGAVIVFIFWFQFQGIQVAATAGLTERYVIIGQVIVILACIFWTMRANQLENSGHNRLKTQQRFLLALTFAATLQIPLLPSAGVIAGPVEATVGLDRGAISHDQIDALRWIKTITNEYDIGVTNKHCSRGTVQENCSDRWFMSSAVSERRFLIESLGYVSESSVTSNKSLREMSDRFIVSPTILEKQTLSDMGVRFLFIDRREPYDPQLTEYCEKVFQTTFAIACKLRP